MLESSNFSFLAKNHPQLATIGSLAEAYLFSLLDANTCLIKLRQFGELLARILAARVGEYRDEKEEQYQLLERLKDKGLLTIKAGELFHRIRITGNKAIHKNFGTFEIAQQHLKYAYELAVWYYRGFVDNFSFIPPAFVTPQQQPKLEEKRIKELETSLEETEAKYSEVLAMLKEMQAKNISLSKEAMEATIYKAQQAEARIEDLLDILTGNLVDNGVVEGYENIGQKLQTVTESVINISELIGENNQQSFTLDSGEIITKGIGLVSEAEVLKHRGEDLQKGIFKLIVMGEFKHGKTTLLNAMLGSKKLPAKSWPLTAVITMLVYGNKDEVAIYETDKEEPRFVSWQDFVEEFQLQIEDQNTITNKETIDRFKNIKYAQIEQPYFLCKSGVRLIDSPGLAENITRTRVTTEFLKQSQAVMFILKADQILSQDEREFIENNFRPGNCNHVFFVINKIDRVEEEEVEQIKKYCKNYLKGLYLDNQGNIDEKMCDRRIFFLNAKGALNARLQEPHNQQALKDSGILPLEKELEEFLTSNQRFRASISSTIDFLISVCDQMHQKIIQRKLSLDEPLADLKKRELEAQTRFDLLNGKIKLIQRAIQKNLPLIESKLYNNYKSYLIDLEKKWLEDCKEIEELQNLNIANLAWSIFDDNKKRIISKEVNSGISKYIERNFIKWAEQLSLVIKPELKILQQEIEIYVKEISLEISLIEKLFAQGYDLNPIDEINEKKQDKIAQLIIGLLLGDFSQMAGTVMGDGDWGNFILESIKQIIMVGGILSIFGGPIEWIILIITEVVMFETNKERKKQKLLEKIGEKVFSKLNEQLPEIEWRIKQVTKEQLDKLSEQITTILHTQIRQVQQEQAEIIALRENKNFSIQEENARLDKIEQEVLKNFNKISQIAFNRSYTIEEVEWLAKGKILLSNGGGS